MSSKEAVERYMVQRACHPQGKPGEEKKCLVMLIKSGLILRFYSLFPRLLKWQYEEDVIIGLPSENYRLFEMKEKHHRAHKPKSLRSQTEILAEVKDMCG